jgi:hypothetical protein
LNWGVRGTLLAGLILTLITTVALRRLVAQPETQADAKSEVTFKFERVGLPVPQYALVLNDSSAGTYEGIDGTEPFARPFVLSSATTTKIFALVRGVRLESSVCASKAKNVANTGTKTVTYFAAGVSASCTYNYSENKNVQQLTEIFQGIAETMDEGRTLERLHRYDRLGLDAEMISLSQELAAGRALQLGTIAPCLRSIADDEEVIQRVRTRAAKLLATVPAEAVAR